MDKRSQRELSPQKVDKACLSLGTEIAGEPARFLGLCRLRPRPCMSRHSLVPPARVGDNSAKRRDDSQPRRLGTTLSRGRRGENLIYIKAFAGVRPKVKLFVKLCEQTWNSR